MPKSQGVAKLIVRLQAMWHFIASLQGMVASQRQPSGGYQH